MTTQTIPSHQGKWKFDGETPYGFDQLDLRIDADKLIYILKRKGIEVKTVDIANNSEYVTDNYLVFFKGSSPVFFVSEVKETSMLCGEVAGEKGEKEQWKVAVNRIH